MIPTGGTLYSFRVSYPSLIVRGRDCTVKLPAYRSGALAAPSNGTYSLIKPDATKLLDAVAVTVSGSIAQYTILAATIPDSLTPLGEGWQEEWALVMPDGKTHVVTRTAALATRALYPTVTDLDLIGRYASLAADLTGSISTFQPMIDEAWGQIVARLVEEGRLPYTIRTPDALHRAHVDLSLSTLFDGYGLRGDAAHYRDFAKMHRASYEAGYATASVQMDTQQTGLVDDASKRDTLGVSMAVNASPHPSQYAYVTRMW